MQLQTIITIPEQSLKIDYTSNVVLLGSCFAENIGEKFNYYKFQKTLNPFGIVFHPLVLERLISKAVDNTLSISTALDGTKEYLPKDTFHNNERYHSFDAHSTLSNSSNEELVKNLNLASEALKASIENASHIIITLGTAWGYIENKSKQVVANCHKLPQKNFEKRLSSIPEIVSALTSISSTVQKVNASAKIIFTVSPVRHIKDGFVENTQSKSHLISAVHQTISETENCTYFPSYEIMMDELRDYRFYTEDMLHPNQTAITYIWERFLDTWLSQEAINTSKQVEEIQRGLAHKPFNPNSEAHQKFLKKLQQKIEKLQKEFLEIQF